MKQTQGVSELHDPILTTRAVAAMLGVAVSTAQHWIESGAIASWKTPGGHRRVRRSAVQALLEETARAQASPSSKALNVVADDEFICLPNPAYPVPANESERLRALAATSLVDTPPEQVFDRLTWLASRIARTPMALVSLLTARRQWFKSRIGLDTPETPREWAFCGHAILDSTPLIVTDASKDDRFAKNPLVIDEPGIRFYAGFPVIDKGGCRIGTLCVLDRQPRTLDQEQVRAIMELAAIASEEIARRI